jgi:teichuronic acid exporter
VGQYALITAMAAILGLLDLSASGKVALVEVSKALGADNINEIRDALAYFLRINLEINGLLVVCFFLVAMPLAQIVYKNADIGLWARWLVLLELTEVPYALLRVAYQSQRNMGTLVRIETLRVLINSLASIGVLLAGWGIPGLILSQVLISCGYAVYSIYQYSRLARTDPRFPTWTVLFGRLGSGGIRSRFWFGFRISVDKNLSTLLTQLPILMLGALNPAELGYFSTAVKVATIPQPLISGIARNLDSFLPFRAGRGQSSVREAFVQTTLYTGLVWSVMTIGLAVVSPIVLLLAAGLNYLPAIPLLFPVLLQSVAVGIDVGAGSALQTLNKLEYSISLNILMLLVFVPIGYLLILNFGGYGAAWFFGARYLVHAILGVALVMWFLRFPRGAV